MKTAIILHGKPSKKEYFAPRGASQSNKHWLPWLQKELILNGVLAQTPEFPEPYRPVYEKWRSTFEQFNVDRDTALVGHSCGGGFLVRWLSQNKVKVGRVVLVAPWLDPGLTLKTGFFDFKIDPNLVKRTRGLTIFVSKDDYRDVQKSVKQLKTLLRGPRIEIKEFINRGHFTLGDMKTEKFPELLDALLKNK